MYPIIPVINVAKKAPLTIHKGIKIMFNITLIIDCMRLPIKNCFAPSIFNDIKYCPCIIWAGKTAENNTDIKRGNNNI